MTNYKNIIFFFLLYISLIIGFFLNENLNYGSYYDWVSVNLPPIKDFSLNFYDTLFSYEKYGHRHSPIYLICLSFFLKLGINIEIIRLIHLHLSLSLIFLFYHCLKVHFNQINKYTLQILAFIILLSPTFRSLSIWPDSRLPGLIFFTLSIYFFLKFMISLNHKYAWLCSISLIVASYISPNFSVFSVYFYFLFYKKMKFKKFINLMLVNLIASIPMFYYLFVLDVNFILAGKTPSLNSDFAADINFNFSNKILIISTIIFFHIIPIIFYLIDFKKFILFLKKKFIFISLGSLILFYFFNYQINFTGGGFFFQLSQTIFQNNILFFIICLFSLSLLFYLSSLNINNFYVIFLLIISNIQNTIYHKYYEPLILILIFVLFKGLDYKNFFSDKKSLIFLYFFSLSFIFLRIVKNSFMI